LAQLALPPKPAHVTLTRWLCDGIRNAIVDGKLRRGAVLPSSRELAAQNGISRQVVVLAYEQLGSEGYLSSHQGRGTQVRHEIPDDFTPASRATRKLPQKRADHWPESYVRPARPFRLTEPSLAEFPLQAWNRLAIRVMRHAGPDSLAAGSPAGSTVLRAAIATHLGASRGLACSADQIVIVSGTQQALDILARLLIRPGDPVWLEDPCYIGASDAFSMAGARIVPVPVDEHGMNPEIGRSRCEKPRVVYVTPAHQFGLGSVLSVERRLALLRMSARHGAILIEDDYDSEFRFRGRPLPAMRGQSGADSVFLLGTFNKLLFPGLRLGYIVVPDRWLDPLLAYRFRVDRFPATMPQEILARFINDGLLTRHIRRLRSVYGVRRDALEGAFARYLDGAVRLPNIDAGLNTAVYLTNGMSSTQASARAAAHGVEAWPIDRYTLERRDLRALMLGFAGFTPEEIYAGAARLAKAFAA
jgi:GntR family transcriptional regulator/MocR family aminotransferase